MADYETTRAIVLLFVSLGGDGVARMLRGRATAEDWKRYLTMSDIEFAVLQIDDPELCEGEMGRERADFVCLHSGAIRLLWDAERWITPPRIDALRSVADQLDESALPERYFRRLVLLENKIKARGNSGARSIERDYWFRALLAEFRHGTKYRQISGDGLDLATKSAVIQDLINSIGLNIEPSAAEKILAKPLEYPDLSALDAERCRVIPAAFQRFPKKSS